MAKKGDTATQDPPETAEDTQDLQARIKDLTDLEPRIMEMERALEKMKDDHSTSMEEVINIITAMSSQIEQTGIPLPNEAMEILNDHKPWLWLAVIHAVIMGQVQANNGMVVCKPQQLRAMFQATMKQMSMFAEVLNEMTTAPGK